ncbi:hypothetical protein LINGRAHAP2_LOCUS30413 [Linum grandiflorum]
MAAPVFVVSDDAFVVSSYVLTQSLLARFFWNTPRPLRLVQSTLKRKWRFPHLAGSTWPLSTVLLRQKGCGMRFRSSSSLIRRPSGCSPTVVYTLPGGGRPPPIC